MLLKTRSLLPYFGQSDSEGWRNGTYILRRPTIGRTFEQELQAYNASALASATKKIPRDSLTTGEQRFQSTTKFYDPNYCFNYKTRRSNYPFTSGYRTLSNRYAMYPYLRFTPGNFAIPNKDMVWEHFIAAVSQVDSGIRSEAYWDMRPKFEGEVSMLNFLYELKDFRNIASLLAKTNNKNPLWALTNIFKSRGSRKALANAIKEPFRSPTKSVAEAHLINSFVITPLISDLSAIWTQLDKMASEAEKEFSDTGAGNTRHWTRQLEPVATLPEVSADFMMRYYVGSRIQSKYTMTASQRFDYTPRKKFNRFCTYWGLVPNFEAIWNGLPFSFLVDYFISIGKSLGRMRTDPNVSNYRLSDCMESVLTSYESGRFFSLHTPSNVGTNMGVVLDGTYISTVAANNPLLIDGHECSFYRRELGITPYASLCLPKFKAPSTGQLINMAALARCLL